MVKLLKKWLNPEYLSPTNLTSIKDSFNLSIQLKAFFNAKTFAEVNPLIKSSKFKSKKDIMKYSYYEADVPEIVEIFFKSADFTSLISFIVGKKLIFKSIELLKFSHKSYTLLHDDLKSEDCVLVVFNFFNFSEEFGGFTSFIKNSEEVFRLVSFKNSLSIIKLDKTVFYFTKYINCLAKDKSVISLRVKFI